MSVFASSKRLLRSIVRARDGSESTLIVPVPAVEPAIAAALRGSRGDQDGLPPHITLLYPFVPGNTIDSAIEVAVGEVIAAFPPFEFSLTRVASFPGVLYLEPQPPDRFLELTQKLCARWPDLLPYGGAFSEVIPHLTVASGETDPGLVAGLERQLPITATARDVWLAVQERDGRWTTRRRFPLRGESNPVGESEPRLH